MGGRSSSKTVTDSSTNISTVTETNIGSIGLSGSEVVELAAVLEQGAAFQISAIRDTIERQAGSSLARVKFSDNDAPALVTAGINPTFIAAGIAAAIGIAVLASK
ncbi:hypothetical protein LCGC14_0838020 [marine sediment metagenome]|uniref:Uncharacterized protein n=1 Tax=marine sediment metagenome TaxID=412755 RepID=A0A0F9PIK9_9ZZZZ